MSKHLSLVIPGGGRPPHDLLLSDSPPAYTPRASNVSNRNSSSNSGPDSTSTSTNTSSNGTHKKRRSLIGSIPSSLIPGRGKLHKLWPAAAGGSSRRRLSKTHDDGNSNNNNNNNNNNDFTCDMKDWSPSDVSAVIRLAGFQMGALASPAPANSAAASAAAMSSASTTTTTTTTAVFVSGAARRGGGGGGGGEKWMRDDVEERRIVNARADQHVVHNFSRLPSYLSPPPPLRVNRKPIPSGLDGMMEPPFLPPPPPSSLPASFLSPPAPPAPPAHAPPPVPAPMRAAPSPPPSLPPLPSPPPPLFAELSADACFGTCADPSEQRDSFPSTLLPPPSPSPPPPPSSAPRPVILSGSAGLRRAKTPVRKVGQLEREAAARRRRMSAATAAGVNRTSSVSTIARQYRDLVEYPAPEDEPDVPDVPPIDPKFLLQQQRRQSALEAAAAAPRYDPSEFRKSLLFTPSPVSDDGTLVTSDQDHGDGHYYNNNNYNYNYTYSGNPSPMPPLAAHGSNSPRNRDSDGYGSAPDATPAALRFQVGLDLLTRELSSAMASNSHSNDDDDATAEASRSGNRQGLQVWLMIEAYERLRDQLAASGTQNEEVRMAIDAWLEALHAIHRNMMVVVDDGGAADSDSEYEDDDVVSLSGGA
ncbi:hypothetical protein JDV02_004416 [Purpureocillium takamizusanense]|uniref:Mating-type switching protein swi10 n=1 Tax=Purpureocillium takamizusanense TaxID=2060973 RepID=A0A9Q8VAS1_9HYPO|nr:uncharacterized protein JDV02_004416 [Purpureocillium takamizusanense]UNI18126.1 hypothetical protein JDV02_004416 [Purpureocillium takamizusanense]